MILFSLIAISFIVFAMAVIYRTLSNQKHAANNLQNEQNIQIAKEQLSLLNEEFSQQLITKEAYELGKQEIENTLYDELNNKNNILNSHPPTIIKPFSLLLVPLFSLSLYLLLGSPDLITPASTHPAMGNQNTPSVDMLVSRLAEKLKQNPENGEGWSLLGRSYMTMRRFPEAAHALEQANRLLPGNPSIMLMYADARTMANKGQITDETFTLVLKALTLAPDNSTGLWLAGFGYEARGEYHKAIEYWKRLLATMNDDASIEEINTLIARAKSRLGEDTLMTESTAGKRAGISLHITISPQLRDSVSEDSTVFIFARSSSMPMPLVAVKKEVSDLPLDVTLNDSMALNPSLKLSSFSNLLVGAKITKSGGAISQSGDLQSDLIHTSTENNETIQLQINHRLP